MRRDKVLKKVDDTAEYIYIVDNTSMKLKYNNGYYKPVSDYSSLGTLVQMALSQDPEVYLWEYLETVLYPDASTYLLQAIDDSFSLVVLDARQLLSKWITDYNSQTVTSRLDDETNSLYVSATEAF